jgi:transcriptional regulator with XRE-family HTH domain
VNRHSPAAVAALLSTQGRAAVLAGQVGEVIKLARRAQGWTQADLARHAGYSQPTISRLERDQSRAAHDTTVLSDLSDALGIPSTALGVVDTEDRSPTLEDVDRRDFLGGSVALAVTAMLPHGVASAGTIAESDTQHCWIALRRLFELDAHNGGKTIHRMAEEMASRLRAALHQGRIAPSAEPEFQRVTAVTMDETAWLAYDAGQHDAARRWWLETCHLASRAGVDEAHVSALASLALQASTGQARGKETVELTRAARAVADAGRQRTPTVLSVLAAREAVGHAQEGDHRAASAALSEARKQLDLGRSEQDPLWVRFWGPADLACHETRVALATGNKASAERSARSAFENANVETFPRNHTIYAVRLGSVLTQLGHYDEAISVTSEAVQRADLISGSYRINADLRQVVTMLGNQKYPAAREFAGAARRLLVS